MLLDVEFWREEAAEGRSDEVDILVGGLLGGQRSDGIIVSEVVRILGMFELDS